VSHIHPVRWRKSSYSGEEGGACIEVAALWRKSSYSGQEAETCVEVAGLAGVIGIRDSKNPDGPYLTLTSSAWRQLATRIRT
jgi:Domain of unknown function (DUF397)